MPYCKASFTSHKPNLNLSSEHVRTNGNVHIERTAVHALCDLVGRVCSQSQSVDVTCAAVHANAWSNWVDQFRSGQFSLCCERGLMIIFIHRKNGLSCCYSANTFSLLFRLLSPPFRQGYRSIAVCLFIRLFHICKNVFTFFILVTFFTFFSRFLLSKRFFLIFKKR